MQQVRLGFTAYHSIFRTGYKLWGKTSLTETLSHAAVPQQRLLLQAGDFLSMHKRSVITGWFSFGCRGMTLAVGALSLPLGCLGQALPWPPNTSMISYSLVFPFPGKGCSGGNNSYFPSLTL